MYSLLCTALPRFVCGGSYSPLAAIRPHYHSPSPFLWFCPLDDKKLNGGFTFSTKCVQACSDLYQVNKFRFFSVSVGDSYVEKPDDEKLKEAIKSAIQRLQDLHQAKGDILEKPVEAVLPFEVIDYPCIGSNLKREVALQFLLLKYPFKGHIILNREFADESIHVSACYRKNVTHFTVIVVKGDGTRLEVGCSEDEVNPIFISRFKFQGPEDTAYTKHYKPEDKNLKKAVCKYLETREIRWSIQNWLPNYMKNRYRIAHLAWLENVKEFVEK